LSLGIDWQTGTGKVLRITKKSLRNGLRTIIRGYFQTVGRNNQDGNGLKSFTKNALRIARNSSRPIVNWNEALAVINLNALWTVIKWNVLKIVSPALPRRFNSELTICGTTDWQQRTTSIGDLLSLKFTYTYLRLDKARRNNFHKYVLILQRMNRGCFLAQSV
jgi:hypothetical protein